ncbi:MAG: hypothetical protein A4E66_01088 [Syntrophus sp. PtaB.Bin001]|nr:MAG: hypothetical protein A4E66_01088 [Syntrophus sp. PtaB.Bin001]
MKRFWVALLAVAMVAGFAMSASAADVKFSGSYYALGASANDWGLSKEDRTTASFFAQRLRVGTQFKIAEGLTLNTQFDALEGRWGQFGRYQNEELTRNAGGAYGNDRNNDSKNISFDRAYVDFAIPYGKFRVGRGPSGNWGTKFADEDIDSDQIVYFGYFGNLTAGFIYEKMYESVADGNLWGTRRSQADGDNDSYHVYGMYKFKGGSAGLKIRHIRSAQTSDANSAFNTTGFGFNQKIWAIQPYAQATFGPVFVEAEFNYFTGKFREWADDVDRDDRNLRGMSAYLHGKVNVGNAYFGALYAYVSGQDPKSATVNFASDGGRVFDQQNLILWGYYSNRWAGTLGTGNGALYGQTGYDYMAMTNAHEVKVYAGFNPTPKWNIQGSVAYAIADHTAPANASTVDYVDHEYGYEADLTASYKIFDNLTYTVGFGYLWAGDYFKGVNNNATVDDTYLLLNKLDLTF